MQTTKEKETMMEGAFFTAPSFAQLLSFKLCQLATPGRCFFDSMKQNRNIHQNEQWAKISFVSVLKPTKPFLNLGW